MKIFKFGGASVKDAEGVKNVANVLLHEGVQDILVVISAMGKMTNAFEKVVDIFFTKKDGINEALNYVRDYHLNIMNNLFDKEDEIYTKVNYLLGELSGFMTLNTSRDYNYVYDQIVGFGEMLSTNIVSAYLHKVGVSNNWIDVRNCIKTNGNYRDAKVEWDETEKAINNVIKPKKLNITQGFLGAFGNETTTLGREGSDYTAGIFAYCLDAESVTIWKDVEGVLNADPRVFTKTELLKEISYTEAVEMAFYGASVIHPKTIQPLEQKNIPLYVRSFKDTTKLGTCVGRGKGIQPEIPCFIVKKNQILISISAKDFSFMVEDNISAIFKKLHDYKLKVNLIQNSAISFSVCVEDKYNRYEDFYNDLKDAFIIKTYKNTTLYTIRHFNDEAIEFIKKRGKVIIRQINTETAQLVVK